LRRPYQPADASHNPIPHFPFPDKRFQIAAFSVVIEDQWPGAALTYPRRPSQDRASP
jgi:hypothetical protein